MYIASQRVRSAAGLNGINTFYHEHNGVDGGDLDWEHVNLDRLLENPPGKPVSESIEVTPGQNHVLSYLDVICPDATPISDVLAAIKATKSILATKPPHVECTLGLVTIRFEAILGLEKACEIEFEALADRVLHILSGHSTKD